MIARLWHGMVLAEKAQAYREFLIAVAIPDYRSIKGNKGVQILERAEGSVVHFVTLSLWEDTEAVQAFAGPDETLAKYYPEDSGYLLAFELRATHYTVVGDQR